MGWPLCATVSAALSETYGRNHDHRFFGSQTSRRYRNPTARMYGESLCVIIVVNSAAGFVSHLHGLQIDWAVTASFAGAATVCSLIAGSLATRLHTERLQRWFAYLVFAVATFVVIDTIWLR